MPMPAPAPRRCTILVVSPPPAAAAAGGAAPRIGLHCCGLDVTSVAVSTDKGDSWQPASFELQPPDR